MAEWDKELWRQAQGAALTAMTFHAAGYVQNYYRDRYGMPVIPEVIAPTYDRPAGPKDPQAIIDEHYKRVREVQDNYLLSTKSEMKLKRYGGKSSMGKRYRRRTKRRFKRKRRFNRKLHNKKFRKMAGKIERFLGETKYIQVSGGSGISIAPLTNNVADAVHILSPVTSGLWPAQGNTSAQRVGDEIYIKNISLQLILTASSAAFTLHPMRVVIYKSFVTAGQTRQELFMSNQTDDTYMTAPYKMGFGKLIKDFVIPPLYSPDTEYNLLSDMVRSFKINIPVNKKYRIDPRDPNMFTHANIYMHVIASAKMPKTAGGADVPYPTIMTIKTMYFKDA